MASSISETEISSGPGLAAGGAVTATATAEAESIILPRVTIQFCTQCKWMLRAAYYAQELLSTFSTSIGEVALQPSSGGTFLVHLYHAAPNTNIESPTAPVATKHLIWDRKAQSGFPETKELKRLIRDIIQPDRDLGHVDRHSKGATDSKKHDLQPQSSHEARSGSESDKKRQAQSVSTGASDGQHMMPLETEAVMAGVPIPKALPHLNEQGGQNSSQSGSQGHGVGQGEGGGHAEDQDAAKNLDNEARYYGAEMNGYVANGGGGGGGESGVCKPGDDCWEG
ncbi:hypothetical protein PVAG01_02372 [Phlyctema vagabunda]|uniref:Uncharacterized protein n=1 Tax=Phlyctema vagabunda TaxID=108571 RepID=A0ABR4PQF3_9HELO